MNRKMLAVLSVGVVGAIGSWQVSRATSPGGVATTTGANVTTAAHAAGLPQLPVTGIVKNAPMKGGNEDDHDRAPTIMTAIVSVSPAPTKACNAGSTASATGIGDPTATLSSCGQFTVTFAKQADLSKCSVVGTGTYGIAFITVDTSSGSGVKVTTYGYTGLGANYNVPFNLVVVC